jgi:hypothetical protein
MPGPEEPFGGEEGHPALLPWFAAGTLDAWTVRRIAEHLVVCAECRRELDALKSMAATLLRHDGSGHVSISDLMDYELGTQTRHADRSHVIRSHLAICATCTEELMRLGSARRELNGSEVAVSTSPRAALRFQKASQRWKWAFYAAAAVAIALMVPALRGLRTAAGPAGAGAIQSVRMMPSTRGDEAGPVLAGPGPWVVEVDLPFGAPTGEYMVHIAPRDGVTRAAVSVRVHATPDGRLSLYLPKLPDTPLFDLTAASLSETGKSYGYAFTRVAGRSAESTDPPP